MNTQATKQKVYEIIERELKTKDWAKDANRLARAMSAVRSTLNGRRTCFIDGVWITAWKEVGLKGKPTYKGLHALPKGEGAA